MSKALPGGIGSLSLSAIRNRSGSNHPPFSSFHPQVPFDVHRHTQDADDGDSLSLQIEV